MTKRMLLSMDRDESRAAVIEDGLLVHIEIEPNNRNTCKGNIYRSTVARVEPSLQSAFVDFGNDKQGFLPVGEIHPKLRGNNSDKRAPVQELIRSKQDLLVQVSRDEIGQKGATLSTFISLPGRYLVLIPESDQEKAGVSRKLSDEARERIKKLTETMKVPEGFGLIVRTAGETATETELAKDLLYLTRQWEHICKRYDEAKGPTLLYAERSLAVRFVRDYFTKDIEEIVIDDDETCHEVKEFLGVLMPRSLAHVHRYAGDVPMFARYGMEGKVEDVFSRQVFLRSGGSIVIDQTEAMVAIDVNSGRVKEKDIEETARATNIEAAQEIAHQLMLRDMGGLVVIDFIDMREKKYVREVETALKDAFKNDKARTKLGHISEFGLLEMSRQRIKSSVNKGTFDSCQHCSGTGRIRAFESVAMAVLRRIYEAVAQRRVRYVIAVVPAQSARYLLNARRSELAGLEKQYHLTIEIIGVESLPSTQVMVECLEEEPQESGADRADHAKMVRVHQELDVVRNTLIKREETRLQIETTVAKRGAGVDYQEIYKEVRKMTPPDPATDAKPNTPRGRQDDSQTGAPAVVAGVDAAYEELPAPRGFGAWLKGLFGLGSAAAPVPAVAVAPAALAGPAAGGDAAAGGNTLVDSRGRRESRDREGRGRGRGDGGQARGDGAQGRAEGGHSRSEGGLGRGESSAARADGQQARADGNGTRGDGRRDSLSDGRSESGPEPRAGRAESGRGEGRSDRGGDRQRRSETGRTEGLRSEGGRPEGGRFEGARSEGARQLDAGRNPEGTRNPELGRSSELSRSPEPDRSAEQPGQPSANGSAESAQATEVLRAAKPGTGEADTGIAGAADPSGDEAAAGAHAAAVLAENNRRRRRRRRRGPGRGDGAAATGGGAGLEEGDEDDGDACADSEAVADREFSDGDRTASAVEKAATAVAADGEQAHADHQTAAAVVQSAEPSAAGAVGDQAVDPDPDAEPDVDAKALMQEEIAKMMAEAIPASETPVAAAVDVPRPAANKRFVIDLRTHR
ncbi:MAG: Rne/Rng family ribonuclease [Myxococcales bacterium]|nr:Rne/Rng family ribonuclease [Myxococcales bacterium]